MPNPFLILDIETNATREQIKRASKGLVHFYHPRHFPGQENWAIRKQRKILNAYNELIKNKDTRIKFLHTVYEVKTPEITFDWIVPCAVAIIGGTKLVIPVTDIEDIVNHPFANIQLPHETDKLRPSYLSGFILWNNRAIPILDLSKLMKLEHYSDVSARKVVLCRCSEGKIAIVVDQLEQISRYEASEISESVYRQPGYPGEAQPWLQGKIKHGETNYLLLNIHFLVEHFA